MKTGFYVVLIFIGLFYSACSYKKDNKKNELVVFCAASLTDVISEISSEFEKENHVSVRLNIASSGTLARQIEHGANPSVFISANKNWMDYLNKLGLISPETERNVAGNSMVLIAPLESSLDSFAFSSDINWPELFKGRLSVGDPQYVPAGSYALQLIKKLGYENELESRLLPAKDVRSALMIVELGEVEAGIIYKTDALKSHKVKIITEFPDSLHDPVDYYVALIKEQNSETAVKLYNYILSDKTVHVWSKYGFK